MALLDRVVSSGTTDTPTSSDTDKIVRITSTTGDMTITLDTEANQSWNDDVFYIERATVNTVSISPATGVTMYLPDGSTVTNGTVLTIPFQNGVVYLKHQGTGTDGWTVGGDIGSILGIPAVATSDFTVGPEHIDALTRLSKTTAATVTFVEDADIPVGASGEIVQWGNGALSLAATGVVLVSLDGDLTLSGLYASIVWTKIDATTYFIRGALAVERTLLDYGNVQTFLARPGMFQQFYIGSSGITCDNTTVTGIPIAFTNDATVDEVSVYVTSGVPSSTANIGLFDFDLDTGTPGDLLVDFGSIAGDTSGILTLTGLDYPVYADRIYVYAVIGGTTEPTIRGYAGGTAGAGTATTRGNLYHSSSGSMGDNLTRAKLWRFSAAVAGTFDSSPSWSLQTSSLYQYNLNLGFA